MTQKELERIDRNATRLITLAGIGVASILCVVTYTLVLVAGWLLGF